MAFSRFTLGILSLTILESFGSFLVGKFSLCFAPRNADGSNGWSVVSEAVAWLFVATLVLLTIVLFDQGLGSLSATFE